MKLLTVALKIRDAEKTFKSASQQEWIELKSILPQSVKNLTGDDFNLFSRPYEKLYAVKEGSKIFTFNDERVAVRIKSQPTNGEKWRLEMTDTDDSVYIKNIFTNEYLSTTNEYAHQTYYNSNKAALASIPKGPAFKWIFKFWNPSYYIINLKNSQYLYNAVAENNNVRVFLTENSPSGWETYFVKY